MVLVNVKGSLASSSVSARHLTSQAVHSINEEAHYPDPSTQDAELKLSQQSFDYKFTKELISQTRGDMDRNFQFDLFIKKLTTGFQSSHGRCEERFMDAEARQENQFTERERGRERMFTAAQNSRADAFEKSFNRSSLAEWHGAALIRVLLYGREVRNSILNLTQQSLAEQFHKISRCQQERFNSAEQKRNAVITNIFTEDTTEPNLPILDNIQTLWNNIRSSAERMRHDTVVEKLTDRSLDTEASLRWDGQNPFQANSNLTGSATERTTAHALVTVAGVSQYVVNDTSPAGNTAEEAEALVEGRVASGGEEQEVEVARSAFSDAEASSVKVDATNSHEELQLMTKIKGSQNHQEEGPQTHHRSFRDKEQHRENQFWLEEQWREMAEEQRIATYSSYKQQWLETTAHTFKRHEEHSNMKEILRGEGETRRTVVFQADEEHRTQVFRMLMTQAQQRGKVESGLEDELLAQMRGRAEALRDTHKSQLASAKVEIDIRFIEGQRHRLNIYLAIEEASLDLETTLCLPTRVLKLSDDDAPFRTNTGVFRWRGQDSPFGFSISTFFTSGGSSLGPLPVPGATADVEQASSTIQLENQQAFVHAQAQRATEYTEAMTRRHQIFSVAEARRTTAFLEKQQVRQAEFDQGEASREGEFKEAQWWREQSFMEAERAREVGFIVKEKEREIIFRQAQEEREKELYDSLDEVMKECIEAERAREAALRIWCAELLESTNREQMGMIEECEKEHDEAFRKLVAELGVEYLNSVD